MYRRRYGRQWTGAGDGGNWSLFHRGIISKLRLVGSRRCNRRELHFVAIIVIAIESAREGVASGKQRRGAAPGATLATRQTSSRQSISSRANW